MAREHVNIRFNPGDLERIRALADIETEGNFSFMVRKLLTEALNARDAKEPT